MNCEIHHTISRSYESSEKEKKEKLKFRPYFVYQEEVREFLSGLDRSDWEYEWMREYYRELLTVFLIDLDPVADLLASLYSSDKRGKAPVSPYALLRSIFLMLEFRETSISRWAKRVRACSVLQFFCGFKGEKAPCCSTYYEFLRRLEDGPFEKKCSHRVLASEVRKNLPRLREPKEKPVESDPQRASKAGVLERLAKRLKAGKDEPLSEDLEKRLNLLLLELGVKPSRKKGLCGDLEKLTLAGDGSTLATGAAKNGKATCDCRKEGIHDCDHPRHYSDPDAEWGWDNREKDYVFGWRFYAFTQSFKGRDLPHYLSIDSANTHEAVMSMKGIDRLAKEYRDYFPKATLKTVTLDAAHDAYAFYHFLRDRKIDYVIPYAKKPPTCQSLGDSQIMVNDKGVPLCPAGLAMRRHGKNKYGGYTYNCPVKRPSRKGGKYHYVAYRHECPQEALCQPETKLGPIVNVPAEADIRVHPSIPRDSKEYKRLRRMRSASERVNSLSKCYYALENDKGRTMVYAFIKLACASILQHARIWADNLIREGEDKTSFLDLFG